MRPLALFVVLALVACEGGAGWSGGVHPDSSYAFAPGAFEPDSVPGIERLDAAAAHGDPDARFEVAFARLWMVGDHEAAVAEFRDLAAAGHPAATGMMAGAYMHGRGVPVDHDEAARWLEQAAALGDERAARDLAAYHARRP